MYHRAQSNIVLKSELANVLRSTLLTNQSLAQHLPIDVVDIYSSGFRDAIRAIATAYNVDIHITDTGVPSNDLVAA